MSDPQQPTDVVVDLTQDDDLIEPSDNSGEPGMPAENQDPAYVPDGSVQ